MHNNDIDPIILGHNQFFGVNHLSAARGTETERHFGNVQNVIDLLRFAVDSGAGGLMLSTHPMAPSIISGIKGDFELKRKLNYYLLLPYISKYVRSSNEKGVVNVVLDTLSGAGFAEKFKIMFTGGVGLIKKDILRLLKSLIDVELLPFKGMQVKAVFLHDVLTDLALGLDLRNIFELYIEHITEEYATVPAFATKNLPLLMAKFSQYGINNPLVLTHFNKIGFQMNPSREACEEALAQYDLRVVAMGTLASGYLKPDTAFDYLYGLPKIESTIVGASTKRHIQETFGIIRPFIKSNQK